jgi:sugar O-acyltransferase (sialic acid O-acetyltransferase NeuD family)
MLNLVIVGAGGFGREVLHWTKDSFSEAQYRIKGFLTNNQSDLKGFDVPYPVLGSDEEYQIEKNDRFIFAIGDVETKRKITQRFEGKGAEFISLVHPSAIVTSSARIGKGAVICPFALVSANVVLEDHVMLNFYASCGHDAKIGKFCILSPYATVNGFASLDEGVFLATHASVNASTKIGPGSKVSANSVVTTDVPAKTLVYGVAGKMATIFV